MSDAAPTWWFFRRANRETGPLTWDELVALAAANKLSAQDDVSTDRATWTPAGAMQGLPLSESEQGGALNYRGGRAGATMLSAYGCNTLVSMGPFTRIMSVILIVGAVLAIGLTVVVGLVAALDAKADVMGAALIYFVIALLYLPPAIYLARCATNCRLFARTGDAAFIDKALAAQKSFWKYAAITALVIIGLYLLLMIVGVLLIALAHAV